jgi:hypothetical protein
MDSQLDNLSVADEAAEMPKFYLNSSNSTLQDQNEK